MLYICWYYTYRALPHILTFNPARYSQRKKLVLSDCSLCNLSFKRKKNIRASLSITGLHAANGTLYWESKPWRVGGKILRGNHLRDSEGTPFPLRPKFYQFWPFSTQNMLRPSRRMQELSTQIKVCHMEIIEEVVTIADWLIVCYTNSWDNF